MQFNRNIYRLLIFIILIVTEISGRTQTPLTAAVDFTVTDINGNNFNLFSILTTGKLVVIDFFSAGSPSSQQASPLINQSYQDFGCNSGNVIFIGVDQGGTNNETGEFADIYGIDFPVASGLEGGGNAASTAFQIINFPSIVLIASDHSILNPNLTPYYMITSLIQLDGGILHNCAATVLADFSYTPQTVIAGNSVDFTDISTGNPAIWIWTLDGGLLLTSTVQNPTGVVYSTTGVYPATLLVSNGITSDSKTRYIHVVAPGIPYPDFVASSTNINVYDTISFSDLTVGNPTEWYWTFVGGDPVHAVVQNPTGIIYYYPGVYTVSLTAGNSFGSGYFTHYFYIRVNPQQPPVDYCDTLTNLLPYDSLMVMQVSPWGVVPGHNSYSINQYADLFSDTTYAVVSGLIVPVAIASSPSGLSVVRFKVWDGGLTPGAVLGYKDITINSMTPNFFTIVMFDEPIHITGKFFAGFQINYNGGDNFAVSMAKNRGPQGSSTLFLTFNNVWMNIADVGVLGNITTSMGILPIACNPNNVNEPDKGSPDIQLWPNPSASKIFLTSTVSDMSKAIIKMYNIIGEEIPITVGQTTPGLIIINPGTISKGLYFVRILSSGFFISKKVIISK
ncbi:MAG: PKD domain-containing protein [Bacteroidia bacterium]|nr:PKD domain-containing protein [Bacteroidia bacterium]